MPQQTSDETLGHLGQIILILGVEEGILIALEQRLMHMHATAVDAENRLGHECGIYSILYSHLLNYQPIGHYVVRHRQSICIPHVYLVLAVCYFMMRVLHTNAHLIQDKHSFSPQVSSRIQRHHVKVASLIENLRSLRIFEVEVFQLRTNIKG